MYPNSFMQAGKTDDYTKLETFKQLVEIERINTLVQRTLTSSRSQISVCANNPCYDPNWATTPRFLSASRSFWLKVIALLLRRESEAVIFISRLNGDAIKLENRFWKENLYHKYSHIQIVSIMRANSSVTSRWLKSLLLNEEYTWLCRAL